MAHDPTKPLLRFNQPRPIKRTKGSKPTLPYPRRYPRERQQRVLGPKLDALEKALASGVDPLKLRNDPEALAPECLLVFELREHALASFIRAIEAIDGLSLAGEEAGIEGDEKAFLYLMVPNQAAIRRLLSLWKLWSNGQTLADDDKRWDLVFQCLHELRRWGPKDRITEADAATIAHQADPADPKARVRVEVEIVFTRDDAKAESVRNAVEADIVARSGAIVRHARRVEIAYDALLVDLQAEAAQALLARDTTSIAGVPDIYAIRPQSIIDVREPVETAGPGDAAGEPPTAPAIAAIIDAMPVQNHPLLAAHIEILDPDDLRRRSVGIRAHGTAIASLVVHGDLSTKQTALTRKIGFRPVMYAERSARPGEPNEVFDHDRLLVDEFVRAVLELKAHAATAGVLIINVSLGDRTRPFMGRASAWARALDWLAHTYGILFIVSAGNALDDIVVPDCSDKAYAALQGPDRARATLRGIHAAMPHRRLLAPAEAVNAVTVGALHHDPLGAAATLGNSHDPLPVDGLPSHISRLGPGIGDGIKPDILMPGGRMRVTPSIGRSPFAVRISGASRFGGLQVAGAVPEAAGIPNAWSGASSGATALTTRAVHFIHDALVAAYPEHFGSLPNRSKALLLKALLLHRCAIADASRALIHEVFGPAEPRKFAKRADNVFRLFGYGLPRIDEVLGCVASRATLWRTGELAADGGLEYRLPLPACLNGHKGLRRLSVTLVWFTAVTPGRRAYRSERLIVEEPDDAELRVLVTRPTKYQAEASRASRGTVFSRSWDGKGARRFADGSDFVLRVARKPDTLDDLPITTDFAVVATLEAGDTALPIYEQVLTRIVENPVVRTVVPIRPTA